MDIKGVQFLSDNKGEKTAVLINLKRHRQLWEDLYDAIVAESRKREQRVLWSTVQKRLRVKSTSRG